MGFPLVPKFILVLEEIPFSTDNEKQIKIIMLMLMGADLGGVHMKKLARQNGLSRFSSQILIKMSYENCHMKDDPA